MQRNDLARWVLPAVAVPVLFWASGSAALLIGIVLALTLGNPWPEQSRAFAQRTLAWSVVGLGAGMDLGVVGQVGLHGAGYTALGIAGALVLGTLLGRHFRVGAQLALLVSVGTAICGGSAIAAVAPQIRANDHDVTVSLVTIFSLNALALFLFPWLGHRLDMGQDAFGLWCALAIHDTSSVVGAAAQYGPHALEVATAAKLARALWILPVTFGVMLLRRAHVGAALAKSKKPWMIVGFLIAAALVTCVPRLQEAGHLVAAGAHRLLALTLFAMGLGFSRQMLRTLDWRPLAQALLLWIVLASATLVAILTKVIA